jgi:hypothetical protein
MRQGHMILFRWTSIDQSRRLDNPAGSCLIRPSKVHRCTERSRPYCSTLSNIVTTADAKPPLLGMVFSASANFDLAHNAAFGMTLTGNLPSPRSVGSLPGPRPHLFGSRKRPGGSTINFGSSFFLPGPAQQDPTPDAVSIQSFLCLSDGILRPTSPMTVTAE